MALCEGVISTLKISSMAVTTLGNSAEQPYITLQTHSPISLLLSADSEQAINTPGTCGLMTYCLLPPSCTRQL